MSDRDAELDREWAIYMAAMWKDNLHRQWLEFARRLIEVPIGYSNEELRAFRRVAAREQPALVRLIDAYIDIAGRYGLDTEILTIGARRKKNHAQPIDFFSLLRSRKLFPRNLDLAVFATRALPRMQDVRYDKLSRSAISARIVEHLETCDAEALKKLARSMEEALAVTTQHPTREMDRRSYLSKWIQIMVGNRE